MTKFGGAESLFPLSLPPSLPLFFPDSLAAAPSSWLLDLSTGKEREERKRERGDLPRVYRSASTGVCRPRRSKGRVSRTAGRTPRGLVVRPSRAPEVPFAHLDLAKRVEVAPRRDDAVGQGARAFRAQGRRSGGALLRLGDLGEGAAGAPV